MTILLIVLIVLALVLVGLALSVRILKQYERGVQFRLGQASRAVARGPGLVLIIPLIDRVHRVSLRIVTMPIQSQGIITRDNVSVDVSAVAYYRVDDAVRSVVAIENVACRDQPDRPDDAARGGRPAHARRDARPRPRRSTRTSARSSTSRPRSGASRSRVVELKDIQLPESMKRAMARQAEAEREKRAKIIAAEGEALAAGELAVASDVMMAHPLALQLRNLQTLVEIAVDKNSTVVFPAPLMSTIQELGAFLNRETTAAAAAAADAPGAAPRERGAGADLSPSAGRVHDARPAHGGRIATRLPSSKSRRRAVALCRRKSSAHATAGQASGPNEALLTEEERGATPTDPHALAIAGS